VRRVQVSFVRSAVAVAITTTLTGCGSTTSHRAAPASTGRPPLAVGIDRAQAIIDDPSSASAQLTHAGELEQLATLALEREPPDARRATLAALAPQAGASMRTDLAAAAALSAIGGGRPSRRLPGWRIVQPPPSGTLLGYFRAAASRFRVPWQVLAAIELIESDLGRVQGSSSAGAQGPMQFLPATWARYGRGSVYDQRAAILGAARFLVASGAPGDLARALYRYNNSRHYVDAVEDYASNMRGDPRAYYGYYWWQVLYARAGGTVILPVGYPQVKPVTVPAPGVSLTGRPAAAARSAPWSCPRGSRRRPARSRRSGSRPACAPRSAPPRAARG
jgi:hypothetical protein